MKKFFRTIIVIVLVTSLNLLFIGCGDESKTSAPAQNSSEIKSVVEKSYGPGQYKIGSDLPSGEYLAVGKGYIELAADSTGDLNSIITNDNFQNRMYITVRDGEYLKITGNVNLFDINEAPKFEGDIEAGHYKIGVDIPAGEYKVDCQANGYFEVTKNSHDGTKDGNIIKNEFVLEAGNRYITVSDGQYLKLRNAKAEPVSGNENNSTPAPKPSAVEQNLATPKETSSPAENLPPTNQPVVKTFDITPYEFVERFNQSSQTFTPELDLYIGDLEMKSGDVNDAFQYVLQDYLAMVGVIDKSTGKVKEFSIITSPDTEEKVYYSLIVYSTAITAINPELTNEQRGVIFDNLGLLDEPSQIDFLHLNRKTVYGNREYLAKFVPNLGLMYIVSPK